MTGASIFFAHRRLFARLSADRCDVWGCAAVRLRGESTTPSKVGHDWPMPREMQLDPPIVISNTAGPPLELSTVEQVIDYVRRYGDRDAWEELRQAAYVAAAVRSPENVATLRRVAAETLAAKTAPKAKG